MKTRLIVMLLAFVLLLFAGGAIAQEADSLQYPLVMSVKNPVADTIGLQVGTKLTVATPTVPAGYFSLDVFGNDTSDIDVRFLLHGYSTIARLSTSETMFNGTVIESILVDVGDSGDPTYTFTLQRNLVYSDGTPITAKDYVFALLLSASPQIEQLGATARSIEHLVGYEEFQRGDATHISGIRLLSDYVYSLTVKAEYLPYFYGLSLLEITPYPMRVIAPGCDILDDGNGAHIAASTDASAMDAAELGFAPGVFSAEMLAQTLLNPETGYVFNPRVTSGPYMLEAYDREADAISFVANPNFRGNYEGQKPHIEQIVFQYVANEDMYEALQSGKVGLINKVINGPTVAKLQELPECAVTVYPRTGLTYLALACEGGVTADLTVRQAIARCIDKPALIQDLLQSTYASPVHGYYGNGQWFASYVAMEDPELGIEAMDVQQELESLQVSFDIAGAKKLLSDGNWVYDAQGEAYEDGVRYRMEADGSLTPLIIRWAKPTDSAHTANVVQEHLEVAFVEIGIGLDITEMTFVEMLPYFYRKLPRTYDMFFLGSNFLDVYDPYYDYHTADRYHGSVNTSGLRDEELMNRAWILRSTPPADRQLYAQRWLSFQQRWIEMMPLVPLYSSLYSDFYTNTLRGYDPTLSKSWALVIPYAWIGEPPEEGLPSDTVGP